MTAVVMDEAEVFRAFDDDEAAVCEDDGAFERSREFEIGSNVQNKRRIREHSALERPSFVEFPGSLLEAEVVLSVRVWLDTVANVRVHATLKERPRDRFDREKPSMSPLPLPYGGKRIDDQPKQLRAHAVPMPIESIQHPLSVYSKFAAEVMA